MGCRSRGGERGQRWIQSADQCRNTWLDWSVALSWRHTRSSGRRLFDEIRCKGKKGRWFGGNYKQSHRQWISQCRNGTLILPSDAAVHWFGIFLFWSTSFLLGAVNSIKSNEILFKFFLIIQLFTKRWTTPHIMHHISSHVTKLLKKCKASSDKESLVDFGKNEIWANCTRTAGQLDCLGPVS